MKKICGCFALLSFAFLVNIAEAKESSLKNALLGLEQVPIAYGTNNFKLNGADIVIVRSRLPSEVAGDGDVYTVIYKQEERWNLVQYQNRQFNTIAWAHTEEDIVSAAVFFTERKTNGNNLEALYLLKAGREVGESVPDAGTTTFELYKVQENNGFNFMEFQKTSSLKTEKKYCNIELALKLELDVSLPNGRLADTGCGE